MPSHATKTDGVWRVMRFETAEVGPEAIKLPPGYKFDGKYAEVASNETEAPS